MNPIPLFETPTPKILSVQQPWAWLIVSGRKTIENRSWRTDYRGPLYIHAGIKMHSMPIDEIERMFDLKIDPNELQFGAIIGRATLVDIVSRSPSPWFFGPFGWVLENAETVPPIPMRGQQGLFEFPADLMPQQVASRR